MAQQHFYSRVPAKVSMFNRADGFDTFACSDGLDEERITTSLSCVYNWKPTKDEVPLIREGKLSPVYFHFGDKMGRLVQSCMTFLPLDYTGERTSYMVHSLLMSEEEKRTILHSPENDILNPALFVHSLDGFDITSFESAADDEYPEKEYTVNRSTGTAQLLEKYDKDMLKRLIYAFLTIACGNGKSVYFSVCDELENCSERTLEFLNAFMQIFPYHIRQKLPFVTFTSDALKYTDFKIKGVLESVGEIPASKGITLHFRQRIALGLQDEAVRTEKFLVDFFFELLSNDGLRREFLAYVDGVYANMPELSKTTMKNMRELVLLFCQCSGYYDEKVILPTETAVHDFLTVYEKYRTTLTDEFRANSMVCLKRFPLAHAPIPAKTFTKIVKMYPTEPIASKKIIMSVMLELIHTDAMRSKLFAFLSGSYPTETEETKRQITADLCRVYYGGFLRPQILEFFDQVFSEEPEESQNEIFEKILLTVRTEGIRDALFAFVEKYYPSFTAEQKHKLFVTCGEVLPDGDDLAKNFAQVIDRCLKDDTDGKEEFEALFCKLIEKEQKRQEQPLLNLVCSGDCPFLFEILCRKAFGEWSTRVISDKMLDSIWMSTLTAGMNSVLTIFTSGATISAETKEKIMDTTVAQFEARGRKANALELIALEDKVEEVLGNSDEGKTLVDKAIFPAVSQIIGSVLFVPGGLDILEAYSSKHPALSDLPGYAPVKAYFLMEKALKNGDIRVFFENVQQLEGDKLRKAMLKLLENQVTELKTREQVASRIAWMIAPMFSKDAEADLSTALEEAKTAMGMISPAGDEKEVGFTATALGMEVLVSVLDTLLGTVSGESRQEILPKVRGISRVADSFRNKYKKSADHWLKEKQKDAFAHIDGDLNGFLYAQKPAESSSWLSKLFKK